MKDRYNFSEIEKKWQKIWEDTKAFKVTEDPDKEKYYVLREYLKGLQHFFHSVPEGLRVPLVAGAHQYEVICERTSLRDID